MLKSLMTLSYKAQGNTAIRAMDKKCSELKVLRKRGVEKLVREILLSKR